MERITMSIDDALAAEFDALVAKHGYANRSEAMRDLLRRAMEADRAEAGTKSHCVASLSYVYNHHQRDLAGRLTSAQHAHHDLVVATMHVHLDHEHCLETAILKGASPDVRGFADVIRGERGVTHAALNLVTVDTGYAHAHGPAGTRTNRHVHLVPRD